MPHLPRVRSKCIVALAALYLAAMAAFAQEFRSGATVANAKIEATNAETRQHYTGVTSESGAYFSRPRTTIRRIRLKSRRES